MTESEKSSQPLIEDEIHPKDCPICGVSTNYIYRVKDKDSEAVTVWYRCNCGVIFQKDKPAHDIYDMEYIKAREIPAHQKRVTNTAYVYSTLIENLTYGRKMLDVGYLFPTNMQYMEKRGWLTWGIELNKHSECNKNCALGDFTTYDFNIDLSKELLVENTGEDEVLKREFDLIWMNDVIEHFDNPLGALSKAKELLTETGVLYISTPDIGFISKKGVSGFPYWKPAEHYVMWSEEALKRELERLGFNIVMSRRNFSSTYTSFYTLNIIAQKNFF